jgi:hypothetical protein
MSSNKETDDNFIEELRILLDKYGIADHFFVGVYITNEDVCDMEVGSEKLEPSNVIRAQRLIGHVEVAKISLSLDLLKDKGE